MIDSFRLPTCVHEGQQYSWVVLCVDFLTKFVYLRPVHVQTELSATKRARRRRVDFEASFEKEYRDSERPQSEQTVLGFREFLDAFLATRKKHESDAIFLHPYTIVTDNGSEFKSAFEQYIEDMSERFPPFYQHTITPAGRSQYNSLAERLVKLMRRYFYGIYSSFQRRVEDNDGAYPSPWHVKNQSAKYYDWVLDVPEVMRRYNSAHQTTIKTTPNKAVQMNGVTWFEVQRRIIEKAKSVYRDHSAQRRLPGFSPSAPVKLGDYVRIREFKTGAKRVTWPSSTSERVGESTKSAADNWSANVYKVIEVKQARHSDAQTYRVKNIDPKSKRKGPRGYLDRTQVLKIHPSTKLRSSGKTVRETDAALNAPRMETVPEATQEDTQEAAPEAEQGPTDPRPPVRGDFRYRAGDRLEFGPGYFAEGEGEEFGRVREFVEEEGPVQGTVVMRKRRPRLHYVVEFALGDEPVRMRLPRSSAEGDGVDEDEAVRFVSGRG